MTIDYLISEEELVLEGVDFRKKSIASAREETTLEARTIHLLERYLALEDLLNLRSVDWEQPRSAPYPIADLRDAEDAASSVREDWGLGDDPIPKLAELLEERGIKVLSLDLNDIDRLAAKVHHNAARVIVIKKSSWSERKRFNLATNSVTWSSRRLLASTRKRQRTVLLALSSCQLMSCSQRSVHIDRQSASASLSP